MNQQTLSAFVWSVADLLRGDFKQSEYGKVILPFAVLRRLDCVLENDLLETIIGLPTDMFYDTGISTYVWIVSNRKPAPRKGKVQLIDASGFWQKMRKSPGSKRRELSDDHIAEAHRAIDLLKERRFALISAVVTGKIDVRGLVEAVAA